MYAIVDFKGTQFTVEKDMTVKVPYMKEYEIGTEVELDRVLFVQDGDDTMIGRPTVENAKVVAELTGHSKDKKIIVFKKKRRKGYQKKQGHRQNWSTLKIKDIVK
ncbi:MAG: 50S ribosomal protein L21 [Candidatus Cloacimonetes bacterium]|nr:50S ribosomal protein L21 [Candidatus Cloacimonadota bacterium]